MRKNRSGSHAVWGACAEYGPACAAWRARARLAAVWRRRLCGLSSLRIEGGGMWSVYLDTGPMRARLTHTLGFASRRAYFGPFAPLRARQIRQTTLPGRRWVRVRNAMAGVSGMDVALA